MVVSRQLQSVSIGGIVIGVVSDDAELQLEPDGPAARFVTAGARPDAIFEASRGKLPVTASGKLLFDSGALWQLYGENGHYCLRFTSPFLGTAPYKVACMEPDFLSGQIYINEAYLGGGHLIKPLEYPLDELIIINLLAGGLGVLLHACGIAGAAGNGYLFVGQSGAGKTTTARLWQKQNGISVLSDDRIILRKLEGNFWIYGTPWHGEAEFACPARARLDHIFFLEHGDKNQLIPQKKTDSVAQLFACSFPPFYDRKAIEFTLAFLEEVAESVCCSKLRFVPDHQVIEFISSSLA
jgi:hypothetical protein